MSIRWIAWAGVALLSHGSALAINDKYARQLERSGCTQVSEAQGCDITKSRAENARAGFGVPAPALKAASAAPAPKAASADPAPKAASSASTPYAGQWVARSASGATVATIRIDAKERVWVNGQRVAAKRSDGGLAFKAGKISFRIQGDRRLKGEDTWTDHDAGTQGPILPQ